MTNKAVKLDMVDTAIESGRFSTFIRLLTGSWLQHKLRSEGPYTLFAPIENGFRAFSHLTLYWLMEEENKSRLAAILGYHVVPRKLAYEELARMRSARTVQGEDLQIDLVDNLLINSARLLSMDIEASNGIIHAIDTLLIPRTAVGCHGEVPKLQSTAYGPGTIGVNTYAN